MGGKLGEMWVCWASWDDEMPVRNAEGRSENKKIMTKTDDRPDTRPKADR